MAEISQSEHLEWLVSRRSAVQADMLKLHKFIEANRTALNANVDRLGFTHLFIGAYFSLWRAVFLGDVSLLPDAIAENAERFLKTVIQDNAIGYPQDRTMREWAFGYYVNNANLRVVEIVRQSSLVAAALKKCNLSVVGWQVVAQRSATEVWDGCFDALHVALESLSRIIFAIPETS